MFEIGFPELVILAVVGLLVLGPERLPKAARFVGLWVRRARAQWYSVKSEFERELAAEEMARSLRDTEDSVRKLRDRVEHGGERMHRDLMQAAQGAPARVDDDDPSGWRDEPAATAPVASDSAPGEDLPAESIDRAEPQAETRDVR